MSSEEDLRISYYSALLAKPIKSNDGDQFTELYDQICPLTTEQEILIVKEKARIYSDLSLETISNEIRRLLDLGVSPLASKLKSKMQSSQIDAHANPNCKKSNSSVLSLENEIDCSDTLHKDTFNTSSSYGERSLVELHEQLNKKLQLTTKEVESKCELIHIDHDSSNKPFEASTANFTLPSEIVSDSHDKNQFLSCNQTNSNIHVKPSSDVISECINFNLKIKENANKTEEKTNEEATKVNSKTTENVKKQKKRKRKRLGFSSENTEDNGTTLKITHDLNNHFEKAEKTQIVKKPETALKIKKLSDNKSNSFIIPETDKRIRSDNDILPSKSLGSRNVGLPIKKSTLSSDEKQKLERMELKKTISNSDSKQFQAGLNKKNSKKQKRKAKKLSSNVELTNNGLSPTTVHENVNEYKEHIGDISSADEDLRKSRSKLVDKKKLLQLKKQEHADNRQLHSASSPQRNQAGGDADLLPVIKKNKRLQSEYNKKSQVSQVESISTASLLRPVTSKNLSISKCLKQGLDSTGCSAASTSEDVSSTSSISSNIDPPAPASDQLSPVFVDHDGVINKMSNAFIQEVTISQPGSQGSKSVIICDNQRNFRTTKKQVPQLNDGNLSIKDKTGNKLKSNKDSHLFLDSGKASRNTSHIIRIDSNSKTPNQNDLNLKHSREPTQTVLMGLRNRWGLDFFVDDFSPDPIPVKCPISFGTIDDSSFQLSFGDESINLIKQDYNNKRDMKTCNVSTPKYESINSSRARSQCKFQVPSLNAGGFNLQEAAAVLFGEWKSALKNGRHYKDLI